MIKAILYILFVFSVFAQAKVDIQVSVLAQGMERPWGVASLPDGTLVITERNGQLRLWQDNQLSNPIKGLPSVYSAGQGGLLDVKAHPNFIDNQFLYFTYAKGTNTRNATYLARAKLLDNKLVEFEVLFKANPDKKQAYHFSGRIEFLPDTTLVFAVGDGYFYKDDAQLLSNHLGKVIRLNDDGSVPQDNPFVKSKTVKSEIFSYGHRNPQGMYYDKKRQILFSNEHGPKGGDEINILSAGLNYGWPIITYGIDYSGDIISEITHKEGMEQPLLQWTPSIAPSSLLVYYGNEFPEFNGHILTTALKYQQLRLVKLQDMKIESDQKSAVKVVEQETYLASFSERLRDIEIGKFGELYIVTDSGKLLKLTKNK